MTERSLEQGLRKRLWVIDIPLEYQRELTTLVVKWYRCSGVEWTIQRLKSLKVDLYRRRSGLPPLTWVRKNRRGDLHGPLGGLFRWADRSDKNFRKVVQSLMCYTVFQYSTVTESQVKKFTSALRAAPPQISEEYHNLYEAVGRNFGGRAVDRSGNEELSLLLYRGSPSKRKPSRGLISVSQDSNVTADAEFLLETAWGRALVHQFDELFKPVFAGMNLHPLDMFSPFGESRVVDPYQTIGGKIAFLQEPGGKLRSVASPFLAYQLALRPFGEAVYQLADSLPWDCTHDQSKPVQTLQDALRKGTTVHSVDLSSATDYFPLEIQSKLMRVLFNNTIDIDLFEAISKSTWISPVGPVRWNRGQPLGLFPSFAVFTVSHGMLLWFLNGNQWKKKFFVLGDDVVILDDNLYHRYMRTLQEWGCPYSEQKSLSSSSLCEFAGKVITGESVTPQYKWREMSNDNFVDIARQLGHRSRILLTKRQQTVFDIIKHCSLPYGLNFSFEGSNLQKMEAESRRVFGPHNERVRDSLVDRSSIIHKNLYGSRGYTSKRLLAPTTYDKSWILKAIEALDERARSVLQQCLTWFHPRMDPRLYSGVPGALGLTKLPPATLPTGRVTRLEWYERMLNL